MANGSISIDKLIKMRRKEYDLIKDTYCPFLNEVVHFNNKGFYHATHDGRGKIRGEPDARMRLHLLPCITTVIKKSTQFGNPARIIPKNDSNNKINCELIFYELCYKFNQHKTVSVILRKQGNGNLHYFSVRYTKKQNRPR